MTSVYIDAVFVNIRKKRNEVSECMCVFVCVCMNGMSACNYSVGV